MERLLVVALMLIALLSSTLAFAGNMCMCVGVGSTYLCGGIGGNCGQKRVTVPPNAIINIEHEREEGSEEIEFQIKWPSLK